jgi:phosphoserine aminotransferase
MFKNEISKNIKVLREVFKLNGNYKVTFVADSVYEIKKV